jgi:hypothetical protein
MKLRTINVGDPEYSRIQALANRRPVKSTKAAPKYDEVEQAYNGLEVGAFLAFYDTRLSTAFFSKALSKGGAVPNRDFTVASVTTDVRGRKLPADDRFLLVKKLTDVQMRTTKQ